MKNYTKQICPYPLGVEVCEYNNAKVIRASFASKSDNCGIVIYDRESGAELNRYPFSANQKIGNVYYQTIKNVDTEKISYLFYENDTLLVDKQAKGFEGKVEYGVEKSKNDYRGSLYNSMYDWEEDKLPKLKYEDAFVYCLHVRGFTKHASSNVKAKGTFLGIIEKIPYLKDLGVTTLELQPVYEFNEFPATSDETKKSPIAGKEIKKLNYWGYQDAYYYAPKREYSKSGDAKAEFKYMVKALHKNNMEVVMQFYFSSGTARSEIKDILRFWHFTYHVDGFHLMGEDLPIREIAEDPYLVDCKLWYYQFPVSDLYPNNEKPSYRNLATYNDGYMYDMRRFLKGDEGMLYEVMKHMRINPGTNGVINYLTNYFGFTMLDLFSYERKHNEDNGEDNKDGNDYNFSWNCGAEGVTRKKQVMTLREKQIKNAFTLLFLSQGTPLIFMGDEFGNSQKGNNNPYCQDNEITWLNWKDLNKNQAIYMYVKELIAFRKAHGVFRLPKECMIMDHKSCGHPDLSYHGEEAWKPLWEYYSRHIGFMLCGKYAKEEEDSFYYVAINMHWEEHEFALPKLPKGMEWKFCFSTDKNESTLLSPRSISVFVGSK